ncbi:DNA endonuclease SmrA [Halomonas urumqiensis]|uniref:DNA endonuclease SmrA n=1 Tax=Halomonas urumqiensis TaxID=1684789 RepID=A0A2N7UEV2_9GAMM|nr:DNA endonuclease SmrA [Halomonas urumqiensis]PMR78905.1 DNA endonuclease SmrA [Halomonas urumqiensis]PTB04189.1 DNA endonuclease SmrA [Halomonas urumqiensis]GHE19539.1 DNA endonuclease SmrA [Halomonas urumqiensis]
MTQSVRNDSDRDQRQDQSFRTLMGDVRPISRARNRADPGRASKGPSDAQLARRESAAAEPGGRDFLSDDFVDLVPPFDPLEYRRDGIQHGVVDRLRHGGYAVQAQLHLLRRPLEECRRTLPSFIQDAYAHDLRSVLVIHGRGQSIDSPPNVLRSYLAKWLVQFPEVQAFVSASQADGGLGATWVMLRKSDRARANNRERQQKRRG